LRLDTAAIRNRTKFFSGTANEVSAATSVELTALCDRIEALEAALLRQADWLAVAVVLGVGGSDKALAAARAALEGA
jgi:hypothetical protein